MVGVGQMSVKGDTMKKKITSIVLFCIGLLMIGGGIFYIVYNTNQKNPLPKNSYKLTDGKSIEVCINPDGCLNMGTDAYANITYNIDNKDIQDTLEKVNKETEELYQKAINSDMSAPECQAYTAWYEHRYRSNMLYYSYTGDDFVSFFIQRMKQDLCVEGSEEYEYEFYYYDINKHKFLTEQEVMEKVNISDEDVKDAIRESVKGLSEITGVDYDINNIISDYHLYYDSDGNLIASYYAPEDRAIYTALVKENK